MRAPTVAHIVAAATPSWKPGMMTSSVSRPSTAAPRTVITA